MIDGTVWHPLMLRTCVYSYPTLIGAWHILILRKYVSSYPTLIGAWHTLMLRKCVQLPYPDWCVAYLDAV